MSNTYEDILSRILNNIELDIDKREGSFTSDMVSALALELTKFYLEQADLVNMSFVQNGFYDYLDAKCSEYGITRSLGNKATGVLVIEGQDNYVVEENTVIFWDALYFRITDTVTITNGVVTVGIEAMDVGRGYNLFEGTELTIPDTKGLVTKAYVQATIDNGLDKETDEELRERFMASIKKTVTSGNVGHYESWAMEVPGVGGCKVFPLRRGAGTVDVVIANSEMLAPSPLLQEEVYTNIETNRPVGADVQVLPVTERLSDIAANIVLVDGYTLEEVVSKYTTDVTNYFKETALKLGYISIARLGNILLEVDGVFDYSSLNVNGGSTNIQLGDTEVPKVNNISLEVR